MSWDVLVLNYEGRPPLPDEMEDAPPPKPLGPADRVRARISAHLPGVSWSGRSGGVYEGDGFTIEFSCGEDDPVASIMLHVRGGGEAIPALIAVAKPNGWSLYDCSTDQFLDPEDPASEGWDGFQAFRDEAIGPRRGRTPKGGGERPRGRTTKPRGKRGRDGA